MSPLAAAADNPSAGGAAGKTHTLSDPTTTKGTRMPLPTPKTATRRSAGLGLLAWALALPISAADTGCWFA